jgi:uncharacterized protein
MQPHVYGRPSPFTTLKLHADRLEGVNAISGYTADSVTVNGIVWRRSVIVPHRGEVVPWPCPDVPDLRPEHFDTIAALEPELVVFGSGMVLRFPPPAALRALMMRRVGVESMDTRAACRTYNILVGEGRRVVAAMRLAP